MIHNDDLNITDQSSTYNIGTIKDAQHQTLPYLKRGALVCKFEGVDTLLDYVKEKMPVAKNSKSSASEGRDGFNAIDTYDEAMTTFRNTPEKVVNFDPSELSIKDSNESGTQVDYDVTGDYIDMGRYMEGIPETMGTMHNGNARNRRVNLIVNLNQAAYQAHEDITHRSERILRLVDALEAGGVRTLLTGIESTQCGHMEVVLKHHEETLAIADLAVVTHPEFLRRIMFRINEYSATWEGGYGSSVRFSQELSPEIIDGDSNSELDIVIDGNMSNKDNINRQFDKLERLIVWELSKPLIEVTSIKLDNRGIYFNPNGARSDAEIKREGLEVINETR